MVAEQDKIQFTDLFRFSQICYVYGIEVFNHMPEKLARLAHYTLMQIKTRLARKALSEMPKNGYRFKLNQGESSLIYHLRNDCLIEITVEQEISLVKFLKQNP